MRLQTDAEKQNRGPETVQRDVGSEEEMSLSRPYDNVFEALEDDPAVAENLRIRSEMMIRLRESHRTGRHRPGIWA